MPVVASRLVLKVYDHDKIGSDEICGSMVLDIKKIIDNLNGKTLWKNLFGSPMDCSGEHTALMNENPEMASNWKGRIMIGFVAEKVEKPEMKIQKIPAEPVKESAQFADEREFEVIAEVGQGVSLPETENYKVKIRIADFEMETPKPVEKKENYCRWSHRFDRAVYKAPYTDVKSIQRAYVYLMDGDKAVCFHRLKVSDFTNPNPELEWLPMTNDLAVGKVSHDWKAGMVSIKLSINDVTKNGPVDFKKYDCWKKPPPKRMSSWKVRAFLFQCRDLPAADSNGSADPYITVWSPEKEKQKTTVVEDNLNPMFFETLDVYLDFVTPEEAPPVFLNVFDKDFGLSALDGDDYMGRSVVHLKEAGYATDDTIPTPKWYKVIMGFSEHEPSIGEILCSFAVVPDDFSFKTPAKYLDLSEQVKFDDFDININVLGLRDLASFGLLPVKKAFVRFNVRSLLPAKFAKAQKNISTQPGPTGPNPTLSTIIKFNLKLPCDPLYCPKLACDVFDQIFKGFAQPLLGTFSIPIGEIMEKQKKEKEFYL